MPSYNQKYKGREFRIQGRTIKISANTSEDDLKLIAKSFPDLLSQTQATVSLAKPAVFPEAKPVQAPAAPEPVPSPQEPEETKTTPKSTKKDDNSKS